MRLLFTFLILCFTLVNADEVQRIESIVSDISKLRSDYVRVQSSLVEMEVRLEEEKEQNTILHQDLNLYSDYTQKEEDYKNKILSLENEIKSLNNSIKLKEKNKIICKTTKQKVMKNKIVIKKCLNNQILSDNNKFPTLLMKEQYKTDGTDSAAYSYRVKREASIYDGVDGVQVDVWEEFTSFTSNERTKQWIKITGYFVEKVWSASTKDIWIKSSDALKREK
ncbi:hypothetical protein JHD49_05300 [Sulfurimonas sp. SAG-AH-194-C21]|nr:hypothetical protein [Sulfurimonas sp. SAG-AH-194-C21]MDF1883352.1 hypothetical protein [Sulfurimonas sp. SAG-AH-194-C21]